jgi:hypothetical protein
MSANFWPNLIINFLDKTSNFIDQATGMRLFNFLPGAGTGDFSNFVKHCSEHVQKSVNNVNVPEIGNSEGSPGPCVSFVFAVFVSF